MNADINHNVKNMPVMSCYIHMYIQISPRDMAKNIPLTTNSVEMIMLSQILHTANQWKTKTICKFIKNLRSPDTPTQTIAGNASDFN